MINIVQIGYGYWGANVTRNIAASEIFNLAALCDMSQTRLEMAKQLYGGKTVYTLDYEPFFSDPSIDAFALCIQTEPSFEVAKRILSAGKHLFIEKPMATSESHARELTDLAKARGLTLHCDHIMVYHPIIRTIKSMLTSGELGDLIYFDVSRMNLGPIRIDVNAMLDLAVHDLAIIDYLSGGRVPSYVEAIGEKRYGDQETLTYLTMKYPGFLAHIKSSWISPVKERRIIIGCTKKMVIFDDMHTIDKLTVYDQGIAPLEKGTEYGAYEFKARTGDILIPFVPHEDALKNSLEHFASCIDNRVPSISDGEQACKVIRILDIAREKLLRTSSI